MRQMWVVFFEELRRARRSSSAYMLLAIFFLITGGLYLSVFFQASVEPQKYNPLQVFWELQWLPNIIWIPLLTMRLFAPERKLGLLESALSTPTTPAAIVLGKYLSVFALYLAGWSSVLLYMFITRFSGLSVVEIAYVFDPSAVLGGLVFCVASGVLFLALGLWCSSLTRNTILAGALTVCVMLLYMLLPAIIGSTQINKFGFLRPFNHLNNLSEFVSGSISISMIVAYVIAAFVMMFATMISLEQRSE